MQYERQFGGETPNSAPSVGTGELNATYCATLVDEFVRLGVSHAVISPGSRSTPISLALLRNKAIKSQVCLDERSAAFVALGIGRATKTPALVVTTSGTATAELHPAVVEADLAAVPLIVCTADRPPELQGLWAPQTIDQTSLFGNCLRLFANPGPPAAESKEYWRTHAQQCFVAATSGVPGPVQFNLGFREPLLGAVGELPPPSPLPQVQSPTLGILDEELARMLPMLSNKRGLIVAGERSVRTPRDAKAVIALAEKLRWPVLADHLSGLRSAGNHTIDTYDLILRNESSSEALIPETVLRLGGLSSSKVTNAFLSTSGAFQVAIDPYGICPDPDRVVTTSLMADISEALASIGSLAEPLRDDRWLTSWRRASEVARSVIDIEFSEDAASEPGMVAAACGEFDRRLGSDSRGAVVVSSSMPVRDLEWFSPGFASLDVFSNRGANGIDGVVSTAVGIASSGVPTLCLIGDVAMLHDSNSLIGMAERGIDLYVLVIDNDGGGIFSFLPQGSELDSAEFETLFGTPHGTDFVALCTAHGVGVTEVGPESLRTDIGEWAERGGAHVAVVKSDRAGNVKTHRRINQAVSQALSAEKS